MWNGMQVKLITKVALEQGSEFAIREGGLTVGVARSRRLLSRK
jgi:translation elongation factor EF-Tu-like GTPase